MAQESREPALEQSLRGLLDPPAGPRQVVGPLHELLQPLLGVVREEEPPRTPKLDPRRLATADQRLAPCPCLGDDLAHHVIEPGQLSRLRRAGQPQKNEDRKQPARCQRESPRPESRLAQSRLMG